MAESSGIRKHKCATIAEAEMVAAAGGTDVLLAYPLVGPNLKRFVHLVRGYRQRPFAPRWIIPTRPAPCRPPRKGSTARFRSWSTWRSGWAGPALNPANGRRAVRPDRPAAEPGRRRPACLRRPHPRHRPRATPASGSIGPGEHAGAARAAAETGLARASAGRGRNADLADPRRARSTRRRMFAGNDGAAGPQLPTRYPDLPFTPAALLLTRVVSHPGPGRLCLDLGYKAVASDPVGPAHVSWSSTMPDPSFTAKSTWSSRRRTPRASRSAPLCSRSRRTSARPSHSHRRAYVIEDGQVVGQWEVTARDRVLGV